MKPARSHDRKAPDASVPRALRIAAGFACAMAIGAAHGSPDGDPLTFSHADWELACDNTGTCRAAGYQQNDGEGLPVSVLLTRAAGAGTPVRAEVALGEDWAPDVALNTPAKVELRIDGRRHGNIAIGKDDRTGRLDAAQVKALLAALRRDSRIEFHAVGAETVWTLSDAGASAVLLKMDDAQGRVGAVGALHRKGTRDESAVPAARAKPVVRAVGAVSARRGDDTFATRHDAALRASLRQTDPEQDCMDLHEPERDGSEGADALEVHRLDADRLLVSTRCWLAAYNSGSGYWVVEDTPPFRATLVTADANGLEIDHRLVEISAAHKGRGLGDCAGREAWTWDGARFVHTYAGTTGLCRGFPGGAWELPSLVTEVVKADSGG